jgi:eukaryotic-like serine/threonine-protein kinase
VGNDPTKLGKYVIKSQLGKGGMGVVYLAEDKRLGRPVALKMMSPSLADDPELLERFYREAQSAGQLRHPNIVTIYDIDEADGIPFIAMEFLEGESLESIIKSGKDVPILKKVDIITQTCRGLHYAHEHGIVHRDVKPANIVVLKDGTVKIVDFGIARVAGGTKTRTGVVMGTPMYMSPEQVLGHSVDGRSDIFSAGVILYELLTHHNPFGGGDFTTILFRIVDAKPESLSLILPNCPPLLDTALTKALAKDREERYQTAQDFAFDLQQVGDYLRKHMVTLYVEQGVRSIDEGNLTLAKESLQRVLEIDSNHNVARSLLAKVQEQIYSRKRTQKVEQSILQAKEAMQSEEYEEAILVLDEILRLEPSHEEARQCKQVAVEERDRLRKIHRYMEAAEKLMADDDLQGAKSQLEMVLALDPAHSAAQAMFASVTHEIDDRDLLRRVRQYTESAKTHLAEKNYPKALELLQAAQQLDPVNIDVESLLRLVRSGQEKEERRKLLDQRLAEIQEALNRDQFEGALRLAESALQEFPNHGQVLKLHAQAVRQVESQRKRRYVEEHIQAARTFLENNKYSAALAVLERALETVPQDARLTSYLKTVREAQTAAENEKVRHDAILEANELIRIKDFDGATNIIERAIARAGQSAELDEVLQIAREREEEHQKQGRIQSILNRAHVFQEEEDYAQAYDLLERSQADLPSAEIDEALNAVRSQWERFERERGERVSRACELLQEGDPQKAVALLETSPRAFFKDQEFQRVYADCRNALARDTAIRSAILQIEKSIAEEDLAQAETTLVDALRDYPGDPALLAMDRRVNEEVLRLRWALWGKLLDEAKVNVGQMKYREAIASLTSIDWEKADLPDIASQAATLLAEARQREEERRGAEEKARCAEQEAASRQTLTMPVSPLRPPLRTSNNRLQATDTGGAVAPVGRGGAARAASTDARGLSSELAARAAPEPTRQYKGTQSKRASVALYTGVALLILAITGYIMWQRVPPPAVGYAQVTTVPWAEIVRVEEKGGKELNIRGYTPIGLELRPGVYVMQLRSGQGSGSVEIAIRAGETTRVYFTFPGVVVNELVDQLVSKY